MKVALAGYGSRGDVEPLAGVGRELLRRGHDVCIAVPPNMLPFVESVGLTSVAFGPDPRTDDSVPNTTTPTPVSMISEVMANLTQAWAEWGTTLTALQMGPIC